MGRSMIFTTGEYLHFLTLLGIKYHALVLPFTTKWLEVKGNLTILLILKLCCIATKPRS